MGTTTSATGATALGAGGGVRWQKRTATAAWAATVASWSVAHFLNDGVASTVGVGAIVLLTVVSTHLSLTAMDD